jgi:GT2 family glycosyltransferase
LLGYSHGSAMELPKVSIIIPNYNGSKYMERCLASVFLTRYPNLEVILVDNASEDGSREQALSLFGSRPGFKLISSPINLWVPGGYNLGARNSMGEYLIFLNNDTVVESDWVMELIRSVSRDSSIGAAQSKILMLGNPRLLDCAGGFIDPLGMPWERGAGKEDSGQYDRPDEIFYAKGAAMMVPRDVFFQVGGFDDTYMSYFEETDLSWRIWLHGLRVIFVPTSRIYHAGGGTMRSVPRPDVYYRYRRNQLLTLLKNYSNTNVVKYFGIAVLVDIRNLLAILISEMTHRRVQHIPPISLIMVYIWLIRHTDSIIKKRAFVQMRVRRVSDALISRKAMRGIFSAPRLLLYGQTRAQIRLPD